MQTCRHILTTNACWAASCGGTTPPAPLAVAARPLPYHKGDEEDGDAA